MAVRFRDIVSRVLRNVGEPEIAAGDTELVSKYNKLIGNFVNTIKEEIEDAGNWRVLRQEVTFSVTAGQNTATAAGIDERARVIRIQDQECGEYVPLVFDITDPANPLPVPEIDMAEMWYLIRSNPAGYSATELTAFAMDSYASGSDEPRPRIVVFPAPTVTRDIRAFMVVPQTRMADSDLNVWIKIPSGVLELGATWYAYMERGEELGANAMFTEERYRQALNSAVSRDDAEQGGTEMVPV